VTDLQSETTAALEQVKCIEEKEKCRLTKEYGGDTISHA
jgi:hypothetical protein